MPTPARADASLARALAEFQAGRLASAEALCRGVLAANPRDAGALHLLGLVRLGEAAPDEAAGLLARAAKRDPRNGELAVHLAAARLQDGDAAGAEKAARRAVALEKDNADALGMLGAALAVRGRLEEAVAAFVKAIARAGGDAGLRFNLANALRRQGHAADAARRYQEAIALRPGYAAAHNNLGLVRLDLGEVAAAERCFADALAADPGFADAHRNLAALHARAGAWARALPHYEALCRLAPDDGGARNALGVALEAVGRIEEAVAAFRAAVARDGTDPAALNNLANALCALHRPADAVPLYARAAERLPADAETLANLGHAERQRGEIDAARAAYGRALAADPGFVEARFGAAVTELCAGRWSEGWRHYLGRESMAGAGSLVRREPLPDDLAGCRVLVRADQGIGDEIFFLRFAPRLAARGAEVVYAGDARLAAMLRRAGIVDAVADAPDGAGAYDIAVAVGDLPYLLGMADGEAAPPPYPIPPEPARTARLGERLAALGPPPYLGLTWRAGTAGAKRLLSKAAPAERMLHAAAATGATMVALQRRPEPGEAEALAASAGAALHDLSALNDDLEDMLALTALLDLYVCVSNTNLHLRAAAGKAAHVLVPNPPEFRWMAEGSESPWFPGVAVYRQASDGSWDAALAALAADLAPPCQAEKVAGSASP